MTTQLAFHNINLNIINQNNKIWLTASDIAKALDYSSEKSVSNLYTRNSDEFTPCMTQVIELMTSGNYKKSVRIFSLRGAHLIAMFARTKIAKEFRRWVLDILDKETGTREIAPPKPTPQEEIAYYAENADKMIKEALQVYDSQLYQPLQLLKFPLAGSLFSLLFEAHAQLSALGRVTKDQLPIGCVPRIR